MFAYCLNNPTNYGDYDGRDACILIDRRNPYSFGHIGFLVQDSTGQWWHFYWGPRRDKDSITFQDVEAYWWMREYNGPVTIDGINDSGQYSNEYSEMIYIAGDFSDCVEVAMNMESSYNLGSNNCSQVSLRILMNGPVEYREIFFEASSKLLYTIPNLAYNYLEETFGGMDIINANNGVSGGAGGRPHAYYAMS